ncbi:hypothetical protein [Halovenus salina]|uniref:Uncharacterized protein n=1 Tax=Halovenus salina TaxID=1510225 RepID=A0ABD5W798_9EURY
MASVSRRRKRTCTDDVIWEYSLPTPVKDDLPDYVTPLGEMKQPVETTPLYRLQTRELVLLATVGEQRVRLRVKTTADPDEVQARFERCLDAYLADRD